MTHHRNWRHIPLHEYLLCHILAFQNFLVTTTAQTYDLGKSATVTLESEPEASEERNGICGVHSGEGGTSHREQGQRALPAAALVVLPSGTTDGGRHVLM